MKEITRIVTAQITLIERHTDKGAEQILQDRDLATSNVTETMKKLYNADNVNVQIQDFVRDV